MTNKDSKYSENNKGPNTEPCGTPDGSGEESTPNCSIEAEKLVAGREE